MATEANVEAVEDKFDVLDTGFKSDARGVKVTSRFDKIMYDLGIQ